MLLRNSSPPADKWHLDEGFLKINGPTYGLWRAVDQPGHVLDILVTSRRDKHAAKWFFLKLLKGCRYVPRVIIFDKWASYGAAKREFLPGSRTPPAQAAQPPRRELAPASAAEETTDAALGVASFLADIVL